MWCNELNFSFPFSYLQGWKKLTTMTTFLSNGKFMHIALNILQTLIHTYNIKVEVHFILFFLYRRDSEVFPFSHNSEYLWPSFSAFLWHFFFFAISFRFPWDIKFILYTFSAIYLNLSVSLFIMCGWIKPSFQLLLLYSTYYCNLYFCAHFWRQQKILNFSWTYNLAAFLAFDGMTVA